MKKVVFGGLFLSFLLIIGSLVQAEKKKGAEGDVHPFEKLYSQKCKSCHGTDGKGKAAMTKALKIDLEKLDLSLSSTKSDEELMKITAEGVEKMPGFGKNLKKEEIAGLVHYIRTFVPREKSEGKKAEPVKEEEATPEK